MANRFEKLNLKNRVFLAPMEEVNDIAFRLLCKEAGAGLTWTPLTSPLDPRKQNLEDKPILQIFATSKRGIKKFMKKYDSKVSGWDFNLGCPAATARQQGYGSYFKNIKLIEEILKEMRSSTKKPLIVKIRKSDISFKVLEIAEKYCDAIAIHPRTREQGYSGEPDLDFALEIKKSSSIPVIYSGNVGEKNYKSFLEKFDFVMIGRAAIGHPEIFSKISGNKKFKRKFENYLDLAKKYGLPFRQIKFHAMQFTKGVRGSRKIRNEMIKAKEVEELEKVVQSLFKSE
ncbi:hypothetical protein B6U91_00335 [Candidatus Pacearchaeota archaeon ex4484_71]|nr:MAG: hypothetical protein B6U91_00335 [Candidatus Pacearchaeota archaeon ex4484_71]